MAIEREIHIWLARGVSLAITSRARAWFHADPLPNDVNAALHAPARLIRHQGSIFVTDDRGAHLLESFPHHFPKEQSVAGLLDSQPMLGFETDGPQRIREAEQLSARTVPQHAANLEVALHSSRTIGAAIGILMARHNVYEAEAFQMLRRASMDTNRKLREVADEVVHPVDRPGGRGGLVGAGVLRFVDEQPRSARVVQNGVLPLRLARLQTELLFVEVTRALQVLDGDGRRRFVGCEHGNLLANEPARTLPVEVGFVALELS